MYFTLLIYLSYGLFAPPQLSWSFDTIEDDMGNPQTTIYLVVNDKKTLIGKGVGNFNELDKKVFQDQNYQIPANALTACAGFWAGLSHHFCVIQKGNTLEVKEGFLDEGATENTKIQYKTIKKIAL